jgi:hypothetical protein
MRILKSYPLLKSVNNLNTDKCFSVFESNLIVRSFSVSHSMRNEDSDEGNCICCADSTKDLSKSDINALKKHAEVYEKNKPMNMLISKGGC